MLIRSVIATVFTLVVFQQAYAAGPADNDLFNAVELRDDGTIKIPSRKDISILIRRGANPDFYNKEQRQTVLEHYVSTIVYSESATEYRNGITAIVELFKYKSKLKYKAKPSSKTLFWPIAKNKIDLLKLLHKNGASLTSWNKDEIGTPLSPVEYADAHGYKEIVEYLVNNGCAKPSPDKSRANRIISVSGNGTLEDLIAFKISKIEIEATGSFGHTALFEAIKSYFPLSDESNKKIAYLLSIGANPNTKSSYDDPLISMAVWAINQEYKLRQKDDLLNILLKHGVNLNAQGIDQGTALHVASKYGLEHTVELLLANKADMTIVNKKNQVAYDIANTQTIKNSFKKFGYKEPPTISEFEFRGHSFRKPFYAENIYNDSKLKIRLNVRPLYDSPDVLELSDKNEKLSLGSVKLDSVVYLTYKGNLFEILIRYSDFSPSNSLETIKNAIESKYNIKLKSNSFDKLGYGADINGITYHLSCSNIFKDSKYSCYLRLKDIEMYSKVMSANYEYNRAKKMRDSSDVKNDL